MAKAKRLRQRPVTASRALSERPGDVGTTGPGRPARSVPVMSHRSWGIVAHVARCGFVVLAAGVLVGGDLGDAGRLTASADAAASRTAVVGGLSIRQVEAQSLATASRAESLAIARAALEAAAAAGALSRSGALGAPLEVRAGLGAAAVAATATEGDLTPEQSASLQALQSAAQVPALPAPLEPKASARSRSAGLGSGTGSAVGRGLDGVLDDASPDDAVVDDAGSPADDASLDSVPPLGGVTPLDEAAGSGAGALDVAGGEPVVPGADGGAGLAPTQAPVTAIESQELADAVERLTALVAAAGGGPLGAVDEIPVVPGTARVASATPSPAAGPSTEASSDAALTDAVRTAAGAVFALSLRMEAATQAASHDEVVSTEQTLVELGEASVSTQQAADALVPLQPLSEEEQAARTPAVRAPSRALTSASPVVADLASRWSNGQIPAGAMCQVEFDRRHLLQCDAAAALGELNEAYRAHFGTDMRLTDSYRSLAGQVAVKQAKGFLAATPGTSNHGWGLAIDIAGIGGLGQFDSPGYLWLKENAGDFGWHHPRGMEPGGSSPQEPWHWEFATD